ncbi:MAG: hypothetical protein RSA64_00820 [Christensenellaceae bacterium]
MDFSSAMDDLMVGDFMGFLFGFVMTALLFVVVLGIVFYVFSSLGLYTIARKRNIEYAWIAWIPVAKYYMIGCVADRYNKKYKTRDTYFKWILLGLMIGALILTWVPILGIIIDVVALVFLYMAIYKVYKSCTTSNIVLIVLSIIFPVIIPFVLFAIRNNGPDSKPYVEEVAQEEASVEEAAQEEASAEEAAQEEASVEEAAQEEASVEETVSKDKEA